MSTKEIVLGWLGAGAIFADGVLFFKQLNGDDHPLCLMLKKETPVIKKILQQVLLKQAGIFEITAPAIIPDQTRYHQGGSAPAADPVKNKLRDDWPFLSLPNCPHELQILAAKKITAFHNYQYGYARLFDADRHNQFTIVRSVVENYMENRAIIAEFEFYKLHNRILGKHPVFDQLKRIKALRKLKIVDLLKMKDKLEHTIWRIKDELKKGTKKHLTAEREQRIIDKEMLIAEIERILELYG